MEFKDELARSFFDYMWENVTVNMPELADKEPVRNKIESEAQTYAQSVCDLTEEYEVGGVNKRYLHINRQDDYVEVKPELIGIGGEACVLRGQIRWEDIPLSTLARIRSHEIAEEEGKTLDRVVKGVYTRARTELGKLTGQKFKSERERLIGLVKDRFPYGQCTIRVPRPNALKTNREKRAAAFAGKNMKGVLCVIEQGESYGKKEVSVTEVIGPLVPPEEVPTRFTLAQKIDLMIKSAKALKLFHKNNVLHRDIKPDNIFVDEAGEPTIADLGLIKLYNTDEEGIDHEESFRTIQDAGSMTFGSPAYMPLESTGDPEQLKERSDVYMLAGTFYTWLTGLEPNQPKKSHPKGHGFAMMINLLLSDGNSEKQKPLAIQLADQTIVYSEFCGANDNPQEYDQEKFETAKRQIQYLEIFIAYGMQRVLENRPMLTEVIEDLKNIRDGEVPKYTLQEIRAREIEPAKFRNDFYRMEGSSPT
jgi:serine/threonine protein kinase